MKWGFGWELGPFETWDVIGLKRSTARMQREGETVPAWVLEMLESGNESFYKKEKGNIFYFDNGEYKQLKSNPREMNLRLYKNEQNVIKKNAGASLIDIGDDVALLEFHSQSNAIGLDVIQMVNFAIEETEKNFKGLVIGNQGKNFCVGANLALMLMEAQDDNI